MRRLLILGIFAAVLILLSLAWLWAEDKAAPNDPPAQTTSAQSLSVVEPDGNIARIGYEYGGDRLQLVLDGDVWRDAQDASIPINDALVRDMAQTLGSLQAQRTIEPVEGEDYGFGSDSLAVDVSTDKDFHFTLTFGGINASTSQVYARLDDDPTLYLLDAAIPEQFCRTLTDLLVIDAPPDITAAELTCITIDRGTHLLELYHLPEGSPAAYSSAFSWFLGRPYDTLTAADTRKAHTLFNDLTNLFIYGCEAFRPDAQTLARTGLDTPRATVTLQWEQDGQTERRSFHIGGDLDETYACIRFEGSDQVLKVSGALMEQIVYTAGSSLLPDAVCLVEQGSVEHFTVVRGEHSQTYAGSDEAADAFFSTLNDMASVGDAPDTEPGPVYASVRFLRTTPGFEDMTLRFHEYDEDLLLVGFDGRTRLLVERAAVDALLDLLDAPHSHD